MLERSRVLWFGPKCDALTQCEFENRSLSISFVDSHSIPHDVFIPARAAVFNFSAPLITEVRQAFQHEYKQAIDHGLLIYLLADNDATQRDIGTLIDRIGGETYFSRRTAPVLPYEIAELAARSSPGREYNAALRIEGTPAETLTAEDRFLLCRAFNDCTSIELKSLTGGRSATVFSVQATFTNSLAGPRPLPFFAKLDSVGHVKKEHGKYREFATYHIPFNLRPNLDSGRCIEGAKRGILVGNFVEKSDSLWEMARKGMGARPIHSLFEDTLRSWRSQAHRYPAINRPVIEGLKSVLNIARIRSEYVELSKARGLPFSPEELWQKLTSLSSQAYRLAPMHGDLHAENVRVRASDAIVIDLLSVERGPLSADLAGLETWLAFESAPEDAIEGMHDRWLSIIDELYEPGSINSLPVMEGRDLTFAWLRDCVRQIRMIACTTQECSSEYQTAVSIYLLRRCMFPADNSIDKLRREYAYFIATKIILHLEELSK